MYMPIPSCSVWRHIVDAICATGWMGRFALHSWAGRLVITRLAVAGIVAAGLVSACSQPSEPQLSSAPPPAAADAQTVNAADEKAWAEAVHTGTPTAFKSYLQKFSSGAHVSEAHQHVAALEEQARKQADDNAWAEAVRTGTTAAFTSYVQNFGSGAHASEAHQHVAALEEQARELSRNLGDDD